MVAGANSCNGLMADFSLKAKGKTRCAVAALREKLLLKVPILPVPQQRFLLILKIIPADHATLEELTEVCDPVQNRGVVIAF